MYRGWRPPPLQNSNSEHLEALKRRQGQWIVAWPPHRALLGTHNHSAGSIDRDLGGSGTSTRPMDRDFHVLEWFLVLLGASWFFLFCFFKPLEHPPWLPRSSRQPQAAPQAPSWRGKWPHETTKSHSETHLDLFSFNFGHEIDENKGAGQQGSPKSDTQRHNRPRVRKACRDARSD